MQQSINHLILILANLSIRSESPLYPTIIICHGLFLHVLIDTSRLFSIVYNALKGRLNRSRREPFSGGGPILALQGQITYGAVELGRRSMSI